MLVACGTKRMYVIFTSSGSTSIAQHVETAKHIAVMLLKTLALHVQLTVRQSGSNACPDAHEAGTSVCA